MPQKTLCFFLAIILKNSRALREELDYGINKKGLPVIVVYPDFNSKSDIWCNSGIREQVTRLWDKLPVFRDNRHKVAVLHVPYKKNLISSALNDPDFKVQTMCASGDYHYKLD